MSILIVLLMFLLVMSISYFRTRHEVPFVSPRLCGRKPRAWSANSASRFPNATAFIPGTPG